MFDLIFKAASKETWDAWASASGLISPGKEQRKWEAIKITITELATPDGETGYWVRARIDWPDEVYVYTVYTDSGPDLEAEYGVDYEELEKGGPGVEFISRTEVRTA